MASRSVGTTSAARCARFLDAWPALGMAFALSVAGCDCSDNPTVSLSLLTPPSGSRLTIADDADPVADGVQYDVRASSVGIATGESVDLVLDPPGGTGGTVIATAAIATDGSVTFTDATLPAGSHTLAARTRGGIQSQTVSYMLSDTCARITYLDPMPAGVGMRVALGPGNDTDGEACGATFETTFRVATDAPSGSTARIFVNGTARGTASVSGAGATFTGVQLDNRGTTANRVSVEITLAGGVSCQEDFPGDILVDCTGASCAITSPGASMYLNADDDTSMAPGFQGQFEVTTDESGASQPITLIVDGASGTPATPTPVGMGGVATFSNVPLSEGTHRVRARCVDDAGNATLSDEITWIVDTEACEVAIDDPADDELFTPLDDVDGATPGTQINVIGTSTGTDCTEYRVGPCSGIMAVAFSPLTGSTFNEDVTLASTAMQDLCAEVRDAAGNDGPATISIRFRSDRPQLAIESPVAMTSYSVSGGSGRIADLDTGTSSCEARFVVACTDVGSPVTLHLDGSAAVLPGGTADCVADAGVMAPYMGRATFPSVALATVSSGASFNVIADQTVSGLTGSSAPVSLTADCDPPNPAIARPMPCPAVLRPATQDEDTATPGFQYDVVVGNPGAPPPSVSLTIRPAGGGSPVYTSSTSTRSGATNVFARATFGSGGSLEIVATATDSFGNTTTTPACAVTVLDLPTVTITSPMTGAVLTTVSDCDPGAGYGVRVTGTTDAAVGSMVSVRVGTSTAATGTVASGGTFSLCAPATDGRALPVQVDVIGTVGTGSAMITVSIDTSPPTAAITTLAGTPSATRLREGCIDFTWTAVGDGSGRLEAYEMRCAAAAITSEADWTAARSFSVGRAPGASGVAEAETVCGFRMGVAQQCTIRGRDLGGALTPLGNNASVRADFRRRDVTVSAGAGRQLGVSIAAVGDVNGDMFNDLLVGANGLAYLYFGVGSAGTLGSMPDVTIRGVASDGSDGFGAAVAGIGDFNGDGRNDFAVAARRRSSFLGTVYVFAGRATWPASIDLSLSACGADVCLNGTEALGLFGAAIAPAGDFNGDGRADLVVGAPGAGGSGGGRVYVVLGSTTLAGAANIPGTVDGFYYDAPPMRRANGNSVAGLGDVNGDGLADIASSAPGDSGMGAPAALHYVHGRGLPSAGMNAVAVGDLHEIATAAAGQFFIRLACVGDYDGNGQADLAAYNATGGGVYVYLGAAGGFSGGYASIVATGPDITNDDFGFTVATGRHARLGGLGDVDGDGLFDLFAGSREHDTSAGRGYVFYGATPAVAENRSAAEFTLDPDAMATAPALRNAAYAGDLNGDGRTDLVVGDPTASSNDGRFVIYY